MLDGFSRMVHLEKIKVFAFSTLIFSFTVLNFVLLYAYYHKGGAVASWLVRSTPERAVRVRALAGDSVLCSWVRHFTLTVPLSTQVYKWVPAICWGNLTKLRGSDLRWTSILSRGSRNTSSRLMLQKPRYAPAAMSQPWLQGFTLYHKTF